MFIYAQIWTHSEADVLEAAPAVMTGALVEAVVEAGAVSSLLSPFQSPFLSPMTFSCHHSLLPDIDGMIFLLPYLLLLELVIKYI